MNRTRLGAIDCRHSHKICGSRSPLIPHDQSSASAKFETVGARINIFLYHISHRAPVVSQIPLFQICIEKYHIYYSIVLFACKCMFSSKKVIHLRKVISLSSRILQWRKFAVPGYETFALIVLRGCAWRTAREFSYDC